MIFFGICECIFVCTFITSYRYMLEKHMGIKHEGTLLVWWPGVVCIYMYIYDVYVYIYMYICVGHIFVRKINIIKY